MASTLVRSPQIGHGKVREPQVLDLDHRFLAQEVINQENLPLVEDLTQAGIELPRRGQVVPEWLLKRDPGVPEQSGGIQPFRRSARTTTAALAR